MGILADLTDRAEAELEVVRGRLEDLHGTDPEHATVEKRCSELEFLLHDLTNQYTSPLVLSSVAALRAEMHAIRRSAPASTEFGRSIANAS